jgi:predicted O-methyltransferase YrrM
MAIDIPIFNGGWSYTQKEMNTLFKFIEYKNEYSILEFGLGNSTKTLYSHFKKYVNKLTYIGYENDMHFCNNLDDNIHIELYDINNIKNTDMPDIKFDLILVDGPNGEYRSLWYSKIRSCVKVGTIILIDDFNHFQSFSDELDRNFNYEVLDHYDEGPYIANAEHSWKIVRVIEPKY